MVAHYENAISPGAADFAAVICIGTGVGSVENVGPLESAVHPDHSAAELAVAECIGFVAQHDLRAARC